MEQVFIFEGGLDAGIDLRGLHTGNHDTFVIESTSNIRSSARLTRAAAGRIMG
jgi:hypothetical protein